ncbi:MAG: TIGR02300 family protein [Bradyrhizobium sp.]|nr:TIGR02300 family protein [Bradyrhizobium sp.]
MAKSDLGTKRICPTTGKKFYDLNKNPVISPYTGEVVPIVPVAPPRAVRGEAARAAPATEAAPEPVEAEELVPLEEADAEENTGKVKAVVPESEDDIEIDETIEDDEDDDSTFIADEEDEGDEDVTDIIGDVGGDEET